jgi:hypothetical protein
MLLRNAGKYLPEDGGNNFLHNVDKYVSDYTASHPEDSNRREGEDPKRDSLIHCGGNVTARVTRPTCSVLCWTYPAVSWKSVHGFPSV